MFANAWNERTYRLGLCWKRVFHLHYTRDFQDPVSNFDPSMSWILRQVPPLREPKGSVVFSLAPAIMSMHAGITDIQLVPFLLRHPQSVAARRVHSLTCIRSASTWRIYPVYHDQGPLLSVLRTAGRSEVGSTAPQAATDRGPSAVSDPVEGIPQPFLLRGVGE